MKPVVHNKQQTIGQQGFTLLELMVVLAIIGILATIGASQFQGYIARARVTEGLNLAQPYKLAVAEQITARGGIFTVAQLGLPAFVATADVTDIVATGMAARNQGGVITITFAERVGGGGTLTLTPIVTGSAIQWLCAARGVTAPADANTGFVAGTLPPAVAPANCRG
ncbi:pilin [Herbaspirillum sp. YR522]|uniref:pilin n=1 Tax=Herbaspirillum sp. YR522 TaxID=1144342 RepID=UPI00026F917E|nr:pilin [Herbaspirillum sp. YR522]EJM98237.1 prepilin-type N-terminal cleavage/methylation domain-containing protein [Herbaspirillum sp. YR522]